jgi:hypothetical protein
VEGEESVEGAGLGFIIINGGTLDITSASKGITDSFDVDEDGDPASTEYDPNPDVIINNGIITITTTGESCETPDASCSPEGIEGKDERIINSGYIILNTADDCLNSGPRIQINGGYIYGCSSSNDAIDSNGSLSITGGTFIGLGGSTGTPTASASTQNSIVLGRFNAERGDSLALVSSSGECVFVCDLSAAANTILISSPDITGSTTYNLYLSGSGGVDKCFKGLYLDNLYYSAEDGGSSITVSSRVTVVGSSFNGPN